MATGYFRQARARKPSKIIRAKHTFYENADLNPSNFCSLKPLWLRDKTLCQTI